MQISRFDSAPTPPVRLTGPSARSDQPLAHESAGVEKGSSAAAPRKSVGDLRSLSDQLRAEPPVRPEVVDAARLRMQQGDYLTRAAAEATAALLVRKDA